MPSQALLDQMAEADIAYRRAQTRDLETKTDDDSRKAAAETREIEARTARIWALTLSALLAAISVVIGAVDVAHLDAASFEILGQKVLWLWRLTGTG